MNNRIYNTKNPFQGDYKKVLCVCSAGLLRSPTAALVLSKAPFNYNTRAAGSEASFALIAIDKVLLAWADEVVCMSANQAEQISRLLGEHLGYTSTPIHNLEIADSYAYRDKALQKLIKKRYLEVSGVVINGNSKSSKVSRPKRTDPLRPAPSGVFGRVKSKPKRNKPT